MFRHRKTKKFRKKLKGGAIPDFITTMKSLIPANHTVSMNTGSGLPTKASIKNPFTKGGTNFNKLKKQTERRWKNAGKKTRKLRKKNTKQKGGLARGASHKIWVCRGNIGCANNINIY
jgi:hypothetical protein